MRVFYNLSCLILSALLFAPNANAAPTKWKLNQYKVIQQAPGDTRHSDKEEAALQENRDFTGTVPGLTTKQMRALEQYFVAVGEEYQRQGFLEPKIDTLTKTGNAFEIYVFDYPDKGNGPARYGPSCASVFFLPNAKPYIRVDSSRVLKKDSLATKAYDNIAHEMFHAIQQSYPLFINDYDDCELGSWITEGTAEAVGSDMALALKKVPINKIKMGPRDYSKPLYVKSNTGKTTNRAYWTSSFWRYIGEYKSNNKRYPPAKKGKSSDYRYLQTFFDRKIDSPDENSELDWLEDNLTETFRVKLANFYAHFTTTFAHYVPDRHSGIPTKFGNKIFQGCERVTLTADITSFDTAGRKFSNVSSRCIEVFYEGPENTIDIQIYLESNKKIVNSIQHIGVQYHTGSGQ